MAVVTGVPGVNKKEYIVHIYFVSFRTRSDVLGLNSLRRVLIADLKSHTKHMFGIHNIVTGNFFVRTFRYFNIYTFDNNVSYLYKKAVSELCRCARQQKSS